MRQELHLTKESRIELQRLMLEKVLITRLAYVAMLRTNNPDYLPLFDGIWGSAQYRSARKKISRYPIVMKYRVLYSTQLLVL
jgi:hypothetical protein